MATVQNIIGPSRFHNLTDAALADELGRVDATVRANARTLSSATTRRAALTALASASALALPAVHRGRSPA